MQRKAQEYLKLGTCTEKNVNQLKKLNRAIFPLQYSENFYKETHNQNAKHTHLAYFNDILVGAICCRLEQNKMYVMTLGVLAPYRRLGIASMLLKHVFHTCQTQNTCDEIYMHVQVPFTLRSFPYPLPHLYQNTLWYFTTL